MGQGRRVDQSLWPADGPYRQLLVFLDRVHDVNGTKSLRKIASRMTLNSPTRVGHMLRGVNGTLPADMQQLEELVRALGGGDDDVSRGRTLYERALRARQEGRTTSERQAPAATVSPKRGAVSFLRRPPILITLAAVVVVAAVTSVVLANRGAQEPGSGVLRSAGNGLSVQQPPWTTTGGARRAETFAVGGAIRYAFDVYNSTGKTVSANVRFDAYWGTRDQPPVNIFDILFQVRIPPGRLTVYSPLTSVPHDALPGIYTEQADVADRADPADRAGHYGSFGVAGRKLLTVPYLTQPSAAQPGNTNDGPACVAMILGSRSSPGQPTVREVQEFIGASGPNQVPAGATQPVAGQELESALEHYGVPEAAISQVSLDEQGLPQAQVTEMAIAIKQGSPVIAFTDGKDLPAGRTGSRSYTGHWLVVVGFGFDRTNGVQVLVNDPDNLPGHGGTMGQPISLAAFDKAVMDAASVPAAQQEPNHIAGIIVAPSSSS